MTNILHLQMKIWLSDFALTSLCFNTAATLNPCSRFLPTPSALLGNYWFGRICVAINSTTTIGEGVYIWKWPHLFINRLQDITKWTLINCAHTFSLPSISCGLCSEPLLHKSFTLVEYFCSTLLNLAEILCTSPILYIASNRSYKIINFYGRVDWTTKGQGHCGRHGPMGKRK